MNCNISHTLGNSLIWLASRNNSSRVRVYLRTSSGILGKEQCLLSKYSIWRLHPRNRGMHLNIFYNQCSTFLLLILINNQFKHLLTFSFFFLIFVSLIFLLFNYYFILFINKLIFFFFEFHLLLIIINLNIRCFIIWLKTLFFNWN